MIKEIIKGIIGILIILGIIIYQDVREYLIPAFTFIVGYYFADNKTTILSTTKKVLGIKK